MAMVTRKIVISTNVAAFLLIMFQEETN